MFACIETFTKSDHKRSKSKKQKNGKKNRKSNQINGIGLMTPFKAIFIAKKTHDSNKKNYKIKYTNVDENKRNNSSISNISNISSVSSISGDIRTQNDMFTQQKNILNKYSDLTNKIEELKQEFNVNLTDKDIEIDKWKQRCNILSVNSNGLTVDDKYKKLINGNHQLRNSLSDVMSTPGDTKFPELQYIKKLYQNIKRQYHKNLYDKLLDELESYYDASNDKKDDNEMKLEIYKILFDVLFICYEKMGNYCNDKLKSIVNNIESETEYINENTKEKIWKIIQPLLQESWNIFVKNKWKQDSYEATIIKKQNNTTQNGGNNVDKKLQKNIDIMNKYIETIYNEINVKYKIIPTILEHNSTVKDEINECFYEYISECCQISWIMVLHKPGLLLYPNIFNVNDQNPKSTLDNDIKYSLKKFDNDCHEMDGSQSRMINEIEYYIWPSLIKKPNLHEPNYKIITKAKIYIESDDNSINADSE